MSLCFLTVTYHVVSSKCMLLAEKARSWPVSTWFPYMQSCGALDWEVSPVHSCGNVCQPQGANPGWSWTPHTFLLVKAMNMRVCACLVWTYICVCTLVCYLYLCMPPIMLVYSSVWSRIPSPTLHCLKYSPMLVPCTCMCMCDGHAWRCIAPVYCELVLPSHPT